MHRQHDVVTGGDEQLAEAWCSCSWAASASKREYLEHAIESHLDRAAALSVA